MKRTQVFGLIAVAFLLVNCGGSDGFNESSSTATTTTSAGTTTTSTGIMIGSGTGTSFVEGALAIGISSGTTLSAGGSTSVTATFVTAASAPYTDPVDVTFTSSCAATQLATVASGGSSTVTTSNGSATATYSALGCSGTDTITATATVGGTLLSATGTITVEAATTGAIQFVSASPTTISLKGTGGAGLQETSTVTFKVTNSTGGPVPNKSVTFSLSTSVGGIALTPTTGIGTTGSDGKVSVIVQSGSVATPVRVYATVTDTSISTQSDQLTVTTGIPVDQGLSVSVETYNPEAYNYDGEEVQVTANVMDRFSNPVPDGTVVNFRAEAGRIQGACTTVDGACSVTWTSQSQQLAGGDATGAVTILAYAIGEERFNDENGNGVFDNSTATTDPDTFLAYDLPEAFLDTNWSRLRTANEPFIDFNKDGAYDDAGDTKFNGVLCQDTSACATSASIIVSDDARLVMSGSTATITFSKVGPLSVVDGLQPDSMDVTIADQNGNTMPAGTTVEITAPSGVEITGATSFTYPNLFQITTKTFPLGFADADSTAVAASRGQGYVEVKVTTPKGVETTKKIQINY